MIEELCISGACNRGICYIGALKKLEDQLSIKKVLGISIGSFIAVCYIIGYTPDEMLDHIINKNVKDFKDISLEENGAILSGVTYKNWVYEMIERKVNPNITLLEFYEKYKIHFIATTTCIHSEKGDFKEGIVYLSHEHTPSIPLIVAINSSMAFPFVFPPIYYNGNKFIDGGILDNSPYELLSPDSLKLKVSFKPIDSDTSINNPISYVGKIYELISKRMCHLKNIDETNVITICCEDFEVIDFEMNIDDKITLFKRGYLTTERFLASRMTKDTAEIT